MEILQEICKNRFWFRVKAKSLLSSQIEVTASFWYSYRFCGNGKPVTFPERSGNLCDVEYMSLKIIKPWLALRLTRFWTAEIEFEKIYNLSVEEIPTAKPTKRQDLPDFIYKDQFSKWNAIAQTCNKISSTGQPILIGTTTVEKSEMLAQLLSEYKLSYQIYEYSSF